jgi:hypothetical protein
MQILDYTVYMYMSLILKMISNLEPIFQINCIFMTVKWTKSILYTYTVRSNDALSDNSKRKYTLYK